MQNPVWQSPVGGCFNVWKIQSLHAQDSRRGSAKGSGCPGSLKPFSFFLPPYLSLTWWLVWWCDPSALATVSIPWRPIMPFLLLLLFLLVWFFCCCFVLLFCFFSVTLLHVIIGHLYLIWLLFLRPVRKISLLFICLHFCFYFHCSMVYHPKNG